jgi:hypothetical protein
MSNLVLRSPVEKITLLRAGLLVIACGVAVIVLVND